MSAITAYEDIDLEETEDLSPEEIEEREIFEEEKVDTSENFFLNTLVEGLEAVSRGRMRTQRIQSGELSRDDPVVKDGKLYGQNFDDLKAEALNSGKLFVDPEFPPDGASLYFSKTPPYRFEWKRPRQFTNNPTFFDGGAGRFDIKQGELGDCWLLAAMANLTANKKIQRRVIPLDQSFSTEYAGIFHFRFWQYGEWVDVVVDDYLPTADGKLVFIHSESNSEFWSALMEKAYAKLHGSYESLKGGTSLEAMVDFTGGCTEMYPLHSKAPRDMFTMLLKGFERCSLKGCSIEPDPRVYEARTSTGLVKGHAYSITKVIKAKIETPRASGQIPLLRVRNPWGNQVEWNGAWSDGSPEWQYIPDDEKERLGLDFKEDGEYWVSYKDFINNFDQVEICNLTPDSLDYLSPFQWEVSSFNGSWVRGQTAGGCRNFLATFAMNPQFLISLEDPDSDDADNKCTMIVNVIQKGRRAKRDEGGDLLTVGFCIYALRGTPPGRLDTEYFKYSGSCARSKSFINLREIAARFKLPPGNYVIIPSTFNPGDEGDFMLRVFTEKATSSEEIYV